MFGPLLSAAVRKLGMAGASAATFVDKRMLAGGPKRFGAMFHPGQSDMPSSAAWVGGAAKDFGKSVASVAGIGLAAATTTRALEGFSTALMHSRENLALFHGGIAASFARMERQDLTLQLRRAQATAPGVTRFAEAVMQMKEDTLQGRILMDNLWNSVGTGLATIVSFISETAAPTLKQISDWLVSHGIISPPGAERNRMQGDLTEFFGQMSRGEFGRPIQQKPGKDGRL